MNLEDLAIADGTIQLVQSSNKNTTVVLTDWQEKRWKLVFHNVLALENFNIEDEDLDRVAVAIDNDFVRRVRSIVKEPDAEVMLYCFFTPWSDEPRLRVLAEGCRVESLEPS
jgi:hypothetical protein